MNDAQRRGPVLVPMILNMSDDGIMEQLTSPVRLYSKYIEEMK